MVLYAAPNGSTTSTCSQAAPCSIDRAFAISDNVRNTIRLAAGTYDASLSVTNKRVTLVANGATVSSNSGATFTVLDGGSLTIEGATIVNGSASPTNTALVAKSANNVDVPELVVRDASIQSLGAAVSLSKANATISHCTIKGGPTNSALIGIAGSTATVERSAVLADGYVVVSSDSSVLRLTNSTIGGTAGDEVFFSIDGAILVSFSTVIDGVVSCANTPAVCGGAGAKGTCFDNSIIANLAPGARADTVMGQACVATYTLSFPQTTQLAGAGNKNNVNPKFKNASAGDLHLDTGSPAIDAANPSATLGVDYDGKSRPQGAQRDLGAFEYP